MSPVVDGTDVMMSVTFCVSAWSELLRRVYFRLEERTASTARQTCECFFMANTILSQIKHLLLAPFSRDACL